MGPWFLSFGLPFLYQLPLHIVLRLLYGFCRSDCLSLICSLYILFCDLSMVFVVRIACPLSAPFTYCFATYPWFLSFGLPVPYQLPLHIVLRLIHGFCRSDCLSFISSLYILFCDLSMVFVVRIAFPLSAPFTYCFVTCLWFLSFGLPFLHQLPLHIVL